MFGGMAFGAAAGGRRKGQAVSDDAAARRRCVPLPSSGSDQFYQAAENNDMKAVRALLTTRTSDSVIPGTARHHGLSPWCEPAFGWNALHIAAYMGHNAVVQLLITSGFDVNAAAAQDRTPLMCAAEQLGAPRLDGGAARHGSHFTPDG